MNKYIIKRSVLALFIILINMCPVSIYSGDVGYDYRYHDFEEDGIYYVKTGTGVKVVVGASDGGDDAPVEYFNLQGAKVMNPEKGVFIKRQGSKATKIIL